MVSLCEMLWRHSPAARVPTAFLVLPTSTHVSFKQLDYELEISIMHRDRE